VRARNDRQSKLVGRHRRWPPAPRRSPSRRRSHCPRRATFRNGHPSQRLFSAAAMPPYGRGGPRAPRRFAGVGRWPRAVRPAGTLRPRSTLDPDRTRGRRRTPASTTCTRSVSRPRPPLLAASAENFVQTSDLCDLSPAPLARGSGHDPGPFVFLVAARSPRTYRTDAFIHQFLAARAASRSGPGHR
jgi:hypothetical protein